MEDGLGEEHTWEEMEEGKPARACEASGGGGEVLQHNSGAVGEEIARRHGEDACCAILHEL